MAKRLWRFVLGLAAGAGIRVIFFLERLGVRLAGKLESGDSAVLVVGRVVAAEHLIVDWFIARSHRTRG